jgi:putative hydrolase of the HAD superfamily
MRLDEFDALSFDCYGTLIDWEAGILDVLRAWAARTGTAASDGDLLASFARHENAVEAADPVPPYPEVLRRTMRLIGRDLGVDVSPADAEALGSSVLDWPAFADSPAALAELARRYRLIILSNVDRGSFRASNDRLGVAFDLVITAEDVGSYKPDPRNFEALLDGVDGLGVAPSRLLHVAQSLYHDHVPAQRAGLRTVWIDRRHGTEGWGATPPPADAVRPDAVFVSMAAFAKACSEAVAPRR